MNAKRLSLTIVLISILIALVNGNLITLQGQCPFNQLKPTPIAVTPLLKGRFFSIAETSFGPINRTDISVTLKQIEIDAVAVKGRFTDIETEQCAEFNIDLKSLSQNGVFDAQYQVAPDTSFVGYRAYFLALDPLTLRGVAFICHDLPNGKYQVEIAVISAFTKNYDKITQVQVKDVLEHNNIGYLNQYLIEIEQNNRCEFSAAEILDSFIPTSKVFLPGA